MMKQCPNCGKDCPAGQSHCPACGTALTEAPPPPEEPTIPIQPVRPAPVPASAPAKKARSAAPFLVLLAVCTVLAAGWAVFFCWQSMQSRQGYESEQSRRIAAEEEAAGLQEQLDKLQLEHDRTVSALADANRQLDSAHAQLDDVSGQLTDGSSRLEQTERELAELIDLLDAGYGFSSTDYCASQGIVAVPRNATRTITVYENMEEGTTFTFQPSGPGIECKWNGAFSNGRATVSFTGRVAGRYTVSFTNSATSDAFEILVIVTE